MSTTWLAALACGVLVSLGAEAALTPAAHAAEALPPHRVISEDLSEQRRQVSVRIERRLKEAELVQISEVIRARQSKAFARTIISFFLPGQELQQGSWATVATTTESKVTVNGLRREDEEVLVAEHRNDKRPLLGSWLTSPPAAPGRLSIFSDDGRIFGEWRLRNGQRTVDELADVSTRTVRRFEVPGGSTYVLTKSGELEIWEKTTLIATAERIRPDHLALPTSVALGLKAAPMVTVTRAQRPAAAAIASPAQPEPAVPAPTGPAATGGPRLALPAGAGQAHIEPGAEAVLEPAATDTKTSPVQVTARAKPKPHKTAKNSEKPEFAGQMSAHKGGGPTPGEQIAAKLGAL